MLVKKGKKTVKLRKVPCLPKLQTSRPRLTVLLKIESFDNIIWYKKCCHFNFGRFKFHDNWQNKVFGRKEEDFFR